MEPHHALHGHTTSMSSIATTVIPFAFDPPLSSSLSAQEKNLSDIPLEATIPLPPSPSDPDSHAGSTQSSQDIRPPSRLPEPGLVDFAAVPDKAALDPRPASREAESVRNGALEAAPLAAWPQRMEDVSMNSEKPASVLPPDQRPGIDPDVDRQDTPTQSATPAYPMNIDLLLDTFRRSRDEAQRCFALKRKVHAKLRQTGNRKRAIPILQHRSRQLVECLHKDRSGTFSSLYSEAEDKTLQVESMSTTDSAAEDARLPYLDNSSSWTSQISRETEDSVLSLLTHLRNDDDFLASHIVQLAPAQINYLSRLHRSSSGSDPDLIQHSKAQVFPRSSRPPSRFSIKADTYETLHDLRRDPLQLLIHGIWDCRYGTWPQEYNRRRDVWSSVCAKLISKGVTGCDNFCVAVLNEFAIDESWKLRPQIEMLLLEWMQTGAFILDPHSAPQRDHEQAQDRKTRLAAEEPRFFDTAVRQILELLVANERTFMPPSCLDLIHATLAKIADPEKRRKAKGYFTLIWYCNSFLSEFLLYPESQGMLPRHHIGLGTGQKILRGIFARLKLTISSALGSTSSIHSSSHVASLAATLAAFLDAPRAGLRQREGHLADTDHEPSFLMLRRSDVLSICQSLFSSASSSPTPSNSSFLSRAFEYTYSASATPSVGTTTPLTGTISSFAPSTSSTSITSDTFFSDPMALGETVAFSVSEASSRPHTPGNLLKASDDNRFVRLAHELQSLATSPQMQQIRKSPEAAGSLFFCLDNQVSLSSPRPKRNVDLDAYLTANEIKESAKSSHPSMYEMLESSLTALALDPCATQELGVERSALSVETSLEAMFREKLAESQGRFDFRAAHLWHRALCLLLDSSEAQTQSVLLNLKHDTKARCDTYHAFIDLYQNWLFNLGRRSRSIEAKLASLATTRRALRNKMWYASEVRNSKIYEETAAVARALATMGNRGSKDPKERGLWAWARKKSKVFGSDRAEQKALSELSAGRDRGGRTKLSDKQAGITEQWMVSGSIENFCQGEERIHRFCLEVQTAVGKLVGETAVASPSLWSSVLFSRERTEFGGLRSKSLAIGLGMSNPKNSAGDQTPTPGSSRIFPFTLSPPHSRHSNVLRDTSMTPSSISSTLGSYPHQQPSLLDSSIPFSSYRPHASPKSSLGLYATWPLPPSPVSPQNASPIKESLSPDQQIFLQELKDIVTGLLLSDIGLLLWADGSETDCWVRTEKTALENIELAVSHPGTPDRTTILRPGLGGVSATPANDPTVESLSTPDCANPSGEDVGERPGIGSHDGGRAEATINVPRFPYEDAFVKLLNKFRLNMDPHAKLDALYELVQLIAVTPPVDTTTIAHAADPVNSKLQRAWPFAAGLPGPAVPRTRLTRLQVVTANCEERRMLSLTMPGGDGQASTGRSEPGGLGGREDRPSNTWLGDPHITSFIQCLLMDRRFYPTSLFRDLQFIAAFLPAHVLDASPRGAAFWTFGLAAMQLKSALAAGMVDRAGQIVAHYYERDTREPVRNESRGNSPRLNNEDNEETTYGIQGGKVYKGKMTKAELSTTSLAGAGRLYALAALEGDPTAARELGLFYLTRPEILKRVTLPLSKPGEVFRSVPYPGAANNSDGRYGSGTNSNNDHSMDIDDTSSQTGVDSVSSGDGRLEPAIFALALHWMEVAADAGDPDARTFLGENGDLRRH